MKILQRLGAWALAIAMFFTLIPLAPTKSTFAKKKKKKNLKKKSRVL